MFETLTTLLLALWLGAPVAPVPPAPDPALRSAAAAGDLGAGIDPHGLTGAETGGEEGDLRAGIDPHGLTAAEAGDGEARGGIDPRG